MKPLRNLWAVMLLLSTALLFSCKQDTPDVPESPVKYEKKHNTAILLVTFGSTWDDPHTTYKSQINQFKKEFSNADIFFSFTSKTCINRWYAEKKEQFITPDLYLKSFIEKNYENVYVQSLHVIPGEEYMLLRDGYVKSHYNFIVQDLKPERKPAVCGKALLVSDEDIESVAKILVDAFAEELKAGHAVAFMGHGNPVSDYDHANASYVKIEKKMKEYAKKTYNNENVFVGTVDYPAMLVDYVMDGLKDSGCKTKTVYLHPLMSIAGDHANNDMQGEYDKNAPDDEQSWKVQIEKKLGWTVKTVTKGLGDYPTINAIWVDHLKNAIKEAAEE